MEFEQGGKERAEYGEQLLIRLAEDLTSRHERGFSVQNLENMRLFYAAIGKKEISETLSGKLALASPNGVDTQKSQTSSGILQTLSGKLSALQNKMLVREYLTALPDEKVLASELEKTRKTLEARK